MFKAFLRPLLESEVPREFVLRVFPLLLPLSSVPPAGASSASHRIESKHIARSLAIMAMLEFHRHEVVCHMFSFFIEQVTAPATEYMSKVSSGDLRQAVSDNVAESAPAMEDVSKVAR